MHGRLLFSTLLLAAPPVAAQAPAQEPPPAPRWIVDWSESRCTLVRQSGDLIAALRVVPGGRQVDLRISDAKAPTLHTGTVVSVSFDDGTPIPSTAFSYSAGKAEGYGVEPLDRSFVQQLAGASSLRIKRGSTTLLDLPFRTAAKAVKALEVCEEDALRRWGIDPAAVASLRERARLIKSPVTNDDYPDAAIRAGSEGSVAVLVTVGTNGKAESCSVIESVAGEILDKTTCRLILERGRYQPAIGPTGEPVASPWVEVVNWVIH